MTDPGKMIPGRRGGAKSACLQAREGHADAAAHRAIGCRSPQITPSGVMPGWCAERPGAATSFTCRRCRPAAGMSVPCERGEETAMSGPLVNPVCCHLDRDRVLARPCRRLEGPQLHRVHHLQPVLPPGSVHRRLPRPGPHPKSLAGKGPLPANAQVAGDLRATCCAEIFLIRNEGGRL
jgi:hypothetical protein